MSYEPLHHKYRPQTFAELVGQEAIATTLSNALEQRRIAPAYLFTGARGTGKTSSARIFAKSLNCVASDGPTVQPCGTCAVCRAIANGSALDVIEIDAASNTGVDNIRELIERAQFAPVQCRYKVYVIDEVHMLSVAAFNALLKTLEEPPDRVVFVLATTDPQKVLPTIISRCQRFTFSRIDLEAMVSHLTTIAAKESIAIGPEALHLIAQISQGGMRDAESLLDQLSLIRGQITVEKVWDLVGVVPERDLLELVQAIATDDPATVLDTVRRLMDRGREPLIVLQNLASFYRDLLIAKTAPHRRDLVAITPPTWAALEEWVAHLPISFIQAGQKCLQENEIRVKNTTQPRLWLEVALMGMLPSALGHPEPAVLPSSTAHRQPVMVQSQPGQRSPSSKDHALNGHALNGHAANGHAAKDHASKDHAAKDHALKDHAEPATPAQPALPRTEDPEPQPHPPLTETGRTLENAIAVEPVRLEMTVPSAHPAVSPEKLAAEGVEVEEPDVSPGEASPGAAVELTTLWKQIIDSLHPLSKALLKDHGRLLSISDQSAEVGITSRNLFKIAQSKLPDVETAFVTVLGKPIKVMLVVAPLAGSATTAASGSDGPATGAYPAPSAPRSASVRELGGTSLSLPTADKSSDIPQHHGMPPGIPGWNASAGEIKSTEGEPDFTPPHIAWDEEDEVIRAAKSFAQMFNGQIVSSEGDDARDRSELARGELSTVPLTDGDDDSVPF